MEIVEYSQKSFAVIGSDTKLYKDKLKDMGGRYNRNLTCGPGYVFSIKHRENVENFIKNLAIYNKEEEKEGDKEGKNGDEKSTEILNEIYEHSIDEEKPLTKWEQNRQIDDKIHFKLMISKLKKMNTEMTNLINDINEYIERDK